MNLFVEVSRVCAIDYPKKQRNKFGFFALMYTVQSENTWNLKSNIQVSSNSGLLCQKKNKINSFIRLFFGRLYGAPICFWSYLTFSKCWKNKQKHLKEKLSIKSVHNQNSLFGVCLITFSLLFSWCQLRLAWKSAEKVVNKVCS